MYRADVGVEATRALEEDARGRPGCRIVAEQVLEHRRLAPVGMRPLEHLGELLRIADEHDIARAVPIASASASDTWPASSMNR